MSSPDAYAPTPSGGLGGLAAGEIERRAGGARSHRRLSAQGELAQCPAEAGPAFAVNGGLANHTNRIKPANTQPIKVK